MRVLLLIRELAFGGADRQLAQLAIGLARRGIPVTVAVFYSRPRDPLERELAREGVTVVDLAKRGRYDVAPFVLRLHRLLARTRPTAVYSFLPLGNLFALLARVSAPGATLAWGVRCSDLDDRLVPARERILLRVEAALSRLPDLVVSNSQRGADDARGRGFPPMKVIANGIDTARFRPQATRRLRSAWGIPDDVALIGAVGKLHAMKDFETFLRAAARVPRARFIWVGPAVPAMQAEFARLVDELRLAGRVSLVPARSAVEEVYAALDILTLCSAFGEGFPNVVGEAMACGTPCVVTDVGDAGLVVGDTGLVVPIRSPEKLAAALETMLERRGAYAERARARILDHFSLEKMVERTVEELVGAGAGHPADVVA
jgi:glycosyltransferase involved in cell wall biosynthesis